MSEPFVSTSASPLRRGQTTVVAGLSPATAVVAADHGLGHELRRTVSPARAWSEHDETLHEHLLAGVSRTFALTIPQLPGALRQAVGNAYLLCRIADTIEDDAALDAAMKRAFQGSFLAALRTGRGARAFSDSLHRLLSDSTPAAERELVRSAPRVVACSRQLGSVQRRAITRCVAVMSRGMVQFDHASDRQGLPGREALDRYCYAVAGVVGEMLTDLFCDHAADIEHQRAQLEQRAIRFGRGLQLTNILKDIWEDLEQGRCWLPRDLFDGVGYDLDRLAVGHPGGNPAGFAAGMHRLVAVAHADLREAMRYTLAIPARHAGVRRFLAWAVLLAAATLRNIHARPLFSECAEVKVTRRSVASMMAASRAVIRSRAGLTALFRLAARGLPVPTEPRWSGKAVVRPALSSG